MGRCGIRIRYLVVVLSCDRDERFCVEREIGAAATLREAKEIVEQSGLAGFAVRFEQADALNAARFIVTEEEG